MERDGFWGVGLQLFNFLSTVNNLLVLMGAYKNRDQKAILKFSSLLHPEGRKYSSSATGGVCVLISGFGYVCSILGLLPKGAASTTGDGDFPPQNNAHREEISKLERSLLKNLHCCLEEKVLPNPFVFVGG